MARRYVSIWFRDLITDWFAIRRPALKQTPFVVVAPERGRMVVTAASPLAVAQGIGERMVLADARALIPSVEVMDDRPGLADRLLKALGEWFIRYTPVVGIDGRDGLLLDATGCAHLWNGEPAYLAEIEKRMTAAGYTVCTSLADTIGAAWAGARFAKSGEVITQGAHISALLSLPPAALRLEADVLERLRKLGLYRIELLMGMPRAALRRRFGQNLLDRLDQAVGRKEEFIEPVRPLQEWEERLPCLEPIITRTGIEIALTRLLESLCQKLERAGKGLRKALFQSFRMDGKVETIEIGTNRPSHHTAHLFKLLEEKIGSLEPGPGIELFVLQAPLVEESLPQQERLWEGACTLEDTRLSELLDRLTATLGSESLHRFLPAEHYWPERSVKKATSLQEVSFSPWATGRTRPIHLLQTPEQVEVSAPIPDYPPMLFRHKGKVHRIKKADGPERIEREWWLDKGRHRDYYTVEDEEGGRYWIFRSGHYGDDQGSRWFLHGYFA